MADWPASAVELWPIDRLIASARNARTHPEAQIEQLKRSFQEWGWTNPILIDPEGNIIAGHGRVIAAKASGIDSAPVMIARGWSEAQKRAYAIADNQLALNSGWDHELLQLELSALGEMGFAPDLMGFSTDQMVGIFDGRGPDAMGGEDGERRPANVGSLADRFGIPPFSVLNAREGWWQSRKAGWISLGIQSELGRGENLQGLSDSNEAYMYDKANYTSRPFVGANTPHEGRALADGLVSLRAKQKAARKANATPGGSPLPAADYSKRQRGNGRGRPIE